MPEHQAIDGKEKTHKIFMIIAIVIAALLVFGGILIIWLSFDPDWKSGIDGNRINFKTPCSLIELINGKAGKKDSEEEFGTVLYYYENRTLFDIDDCEISYYGGMFGGVNQIKADIPINGDAEDEFEKIVGVMIDSYSERRGFYQKEDVVNSDSLRTVSFGTNLGAVGISVSIELLQDKITIEESAAY